MAEQDETGTYWLHAKLSAEARSGIRLLCALGDGSTSKVLSRLFTDPIYARALFDQLEMIQNNGGGAGSSPSSEI